MDITLATPLLGGLTPRAFMRRHWQKRPLLVRGAVTGDALAAIARADLFELAARDEVQSRLIERRDGRWRLRHGPFARRALPPLSRPHWTLLVQGVDLQLDAAHRLLSAFRFVPDARLDDLMVSYASDGGGVGPHVDSYDVFLLQLHGRRRWRVGPCSSPAFLPGLPLKILERFEPQDDWLLDAGDMLYLPPGWAHDGVADGECLTASIGFRSASRAEIVHQMLQRWLDADDLGEGIERLYRDPSQAAAANPARIPQRLQGYAAQAVARALADRSQLDCSLGEWLSEPAPGVVFDDVHEVPRSTNGASAWRLDRRTRMLYDDRHVFINGESFRASGRDAALMRRFADARRLDAVEHRALGVDACALLEDWAEAGWIHRVTAGAGRSGEDEGS